MHRPDRKNEYITTLTVFTYVTAALGAGVGVGAMTLAAYALNAFAWSL